jgi:hypothetical protein
MVYGSDVMTVASAIAVLTKNIKEITVRQYISFFIFYLLLLLLRFIFVPFCTLL